MCSRCVVVCQVVGTDTSSRVARTASKHHIKTTSGSLLHAGEVALTALKYRIKTTSSSLLHAREVVAQTAMFLRLVLHVREVEDAATASKCAKNPPPAHFCTRGRWSGQESHFASEEDGAQEGAAPRKDHLRLVFSCEGGKGGREHH